ncbi:histidine phosphatase family protein [Periweissella beninensis]|uniref:Histidine phosphatase family protein n=1 Tax=Periweissella beninensis TaxID=504936 RepID=A0ABT0VHV1_9LACO|nr:histidine phosphatase family protein [Periweissella beninensis]MBM7544029.1 putative phosphoglycerate mutase [Periweissella beninensis]MCM2437413.1 histidine phosphatase family protein [Periweissella beninensis]MCT4396415.1 histidine phosphatase family protein [Periweissella beninensis]
MTDFYLIRHGQTAANAAGLKQGIINTEITKLNKLGIKQVESLQAVFDISFANQIIASPLDRTQHTANILNKSAMLPFTTDERLLEISYGSWDGRPNQELEKAYPQVFDRTLHDVLPTYVTIASDGETFEMVMKRIQTLLLELTKKYPTQKIILVTHGFTIKAATLVCLAMTNKLMTLPEPNNASVTKISVNPQTKEAYLWYYNQNANNQF